MKVDQNHIFDEILDEDEHVIDVFRPNKVRYLVLNLCFCFLAIVFLGFGLIIGGIITLAWLGEKDAHIYLSLILTGVALIIICICIIVWLCMVYNKTFYAITNKHILTRTGFIGADYRVMSLTSITSITVKVGLLDKIIRPVNTGSISLANASTPFLINSHNMKVSLFNLESIDNPYERFKIIKKIVSESQDQLKK